ncbi:MAG: hypothetical protein OES57_07030, partial [Acidimicrobiia bacterium]|nr:hypothetical protein [Acidimicrobiia bacterium]
MVRWNSEQQRQPVDSGTTHRGLSTPAGEADDPTRLIPLPDLDAEPPTEAPRITNKAPTLADTLLGARATTPEAALPAPAPDTAVSPAASPPAASPPAAAPADTGAAPGVERWERPDRAAAPLDDTATAAPAASAAATVPDSTSAPERTVRGDPTSAPPVETEPAPQEATPETDVGRRSDRLVNIGVIALAVVLSAGAAYLLLRDDGSSDSGEASDLRAVSAL